MVLDIKKAALDASGGKAVFYAKNSKAIKEALQDMPNLDRETILSTVRKRVADMDEFQLKHCGSELAEMLVPVLEYKDEAQAEQARRDAQTEAILAEIAERRKAEEAERAQEETITSSVGLFGEPQAVQDSEGLKR